MNVKENRSKSYKNTNIEISENKKIASTENANKENEENEERKLNNREDSFINKSISSEYKKNVTNPNVSSIKKQREGNMDTQFKLRKIFEYYCQFGERMNINYIKSQKYFKLMTDCRIVDEVLTKTRIELIFSAENKHKPQMVFDTFLNSLIKIAELKYSQLPNNQAVQVLIREHFIPRYEQLFEFNQGKQELQVMSSNNLESSGIIDNRNSMVMCNNEFHFETDTEELLALIAPVMFDIYKVYFPFELSLAENMNFVLENSQKYYFIFLKDFDLCPTIISKSTCFQIFQTEINNHLEISENYLNIIQNLDFNNIKKFSTKNVLGQYFNFFKFLRSIMRIADFSFDKLETNVTRKLTLFEKLCLCLERMELSEGFLTIQQKTSKTHNRRTSSIIPKEIAEKVKANIFESTDGGEFGSSENNMEGNQSTQPNRTLNRLRRSITGIVEKPVFEHGSYILEKFGNDLNNIFKFYCSYGDPLNTTYLTNTKWTKMLREGGLIKGAKNDSKQNTVIVENNGEYGIPYNDIDRHYFKVTNTAEKPRESIVVNSTTISLKGTDPKNKIVNSNSKIDFNTFISLLEYTCGIIFPQKDLKESITYIITHHFLPLGKNINNRNPSAHINFLMEKQTKPELVEILVLVHKAFLPIYKHYANRYTFLMNFDAFLLFCRDFSIFPDIVPKSKLNLFFKSISACMSLSEQQDLLALCAFEIPYRDPQPSPVEKILFFLEKLSQSEGTNKILLRSGSTRLSSGDNLDFLTPFKHHYADYFTIKVVKKPKFMDLLNDES